MCGGGLMAGGAWVGADLPMASGTMGCTCAEACPAVWEWKRGVGAGGAWARWSDPTPLPLGPCVNMRCHLPSPHGLLPRLAVLAVGCVFFPP